MSVVSVCWFDSAFFGRTFRSRAISLDSDAELWTNKSDHILHCGLSDGKLLNPLC